MDNFAEPDFNTVTRLPPADVSTGDDDLDSARVEARQYLEFYNWVRSIKGEYLDMAPKELSTSSFSK